MRHTRKNSNREAQYSTVAQNTVAARDFVIPPVSGDDCVDHKIVRGVDAFQDVFEIIQEKHAARRSSYSITEGSMGYRG